MSGGSEARIERYFQLRARWNRSHNLVGPGALEAQDRLDVEACLRLLKPGLRLVDIGSGGGVPGLLLACLSPDFPITLIEPRVKRVAFLRSAQADLKLTQVQILRQRWPCSLTEESQLISRAVIDPGRWPQWALEGGEQVRSVFRMLAAKRPLWPKSPLYLAASYEYETEQGARRIERWDR